MEENEDEPEDVRKATPVEYEIRKGEIDEFIKQPTMKRAFKADKPEHCCPKSKPIVERVECCPEKKKKEQPPVLTQHCENPYKRVKLDLVARHCLTKEKHLDFLATPKYIRQNNEPEQESKIIRRIRTLYPRTEWLSKPTKRRMLMTLVYQGRTLPINMVDHLIESLEGETAITPEQAEDLVRKKQNYKKKSQKKEKTSKCESKKRPRREESLSGGDPSLDLEVAYCQYLMAQRFVRSILNWKCAYPRDDYKDIAEVILDRISKQLEYTPLGKEDRKSEQMRILADVFACWIAGILMQVAEKYGTDFDKEAEAVQKICEEDKKKKQDDEDEDYSDEEDEYPKYLEVCPRINILEKCTQADEKEEEDDDVVNEDAGSTTSSDVCVDVEQQTEYRPKADCGTTTHTRMDKQVKIDECNQANVKCEEEKELDKICSRLSNAFETDIPFITFAKIIETLYCMIGCEPENDLCDPIDNRIHRAIYEKFEAVMCQEDPKLMTDRTKDILDIITGKLARWLRRALNNRQINFFEQNPGQVESREIRDWAQWMEDTVEVADNWANWIHKIKMEAECINRGGGITRGDWEDWTGKFESNAMLFRRAYLETVHKEHHNNMMYCEREVLKTCKKKKPQYSEQTIKNTNYESCLIHK